MPRHRRPWLLRVNRSRREEEKETDRAKPLRSRATRRGNRSARATAWPGCERGRDRPWLLRVNRSRREEEKETDRAKPLRSRATRRGNRSARATAWPGYKRG